MSDSNIKRNRLLAFETWQLSERAIVNLMFFDYFAVNLGEVTEKGVAAFFPRKFFEEFFDQNISLVSETVSANGTFLTFSLQGVKTRVANAVVIDTDVDGRFQHGLHTDRALEDILDLRIPVKLL